MSMTDSTTSSGDWSGYLAKKAITLGEVMVIADILAGQTWGNSIIVVWVSDVFKWIYEIVNDVKGLKNTNYIVITI